MQVDQGGANIVAFVGANKAMRVPAIAEVRAYWEALRNGRKVPLRSEIDPRGIERSLEYAFILERIAPQMARFRLAGMHLNDLMGMEVRGMPLTAFFTAVARPQVAAILEDVFKKPQIAELTLAAEAGMGKPPMSAKLLILPMQSDLGDITRALGCLVADGMVGRAPRRFDLVEAALTPIVEGHPTVRAAYKMARGFADDQAALEGPSKSERGYLRLVKTDE